MAISTRMLCNPVTPSAQSPSTGARPSSSRPSSVKNAMAASMSSTTMPTLSMRLIVMMPPWGFADHWLAVLLVPITSVPPLRPRAIATNRSRILEDRGPVDRQVQVLDSRNAGPCHERKQPLPPESHRALSHQSERLRDEEVARGGRFHPQRRTFPQG